MELICKFYSIIQNSSYDLENIIMQFIPRLFSLHWHYETVFFTTLSYLAFDTHCFHSILYMRCVFTYVNDRDRKQTILWKGHQAQLLLPLPKIVHLRTECTVLRIFIFKQTIEKHIILEALTFFFKIMCIIINF